MNIKSKEHYELMEEFERQFKHLRLDREPKDGWARGRLYQDGAVNQLFDAFRRGYALGRFVG